MNKFDKLLKYIKTTGPCAIAFSGGTDSTLLLAAAKSVLGDNILAVTFYTSYIPKWEIEETKQITESMGIKHIIVEAPIINEIRNNPSNRCYLCKRSLFSILKTECKKHGYTAILEATNADDKEEFRPGMRALKELKIQSPLSELGFSKNDIRKFSKELNLSTWEKPPFACLLTRMPYHTPVDEMELNRIEKSEVYLFSLGFKLVRVRSHGNLARIELGEEEKSIIYNENLMKKIAKELEKYGYRYISLDLEGYKTGNMS